MTLGGNMKILQVESILRSKGVALGGYSGNYEFWNIKEHQTKKGCWRGGAKNLKEVLDQYMDFSDDKIHLLPKKMQDHINCINYDL